MEKYNRKAVFEEFDDLIATNEHEYCEVTQWRNGEGIDVSFGDKSFSLTWDEFSILKRLGTYLYEYDRCVDNG